MKKGFTFIELIIVIAIILILSVAVIVNFNSYNDRERVRQAGLTIKSDLRLVNSKVNSGIKSTTCVTLVSYDVSFMNVCPSDARSCYTITPRCSNGNDTATTVYLPKEVHFQSADLTIRFFPLSAGTDLTTDAIITLTGLSTPYTIKINPSGAVSDYSGP